MTTTAAPSPLRGPAKSDSGGDYKTDVPSADVHDARVVALVDLGSHLESFQGGEPKRQRKVFLVYELDEEVSGMKGVNHVVAVKYTLSFHEKATLRKLAETLLNEGQKYPAEHPIDYAALVGAPCTVTITHQQGTGDKADRKYAKVGVISAVPRKRRDGVFKPRRALKVWVVGDPIEQLPDYLPRDYGEKVQDVIARCLELTASAPASGEGAVGDDNGQDDPPF